MRHFWGSSAANWTSLWMLRPTDCAADWRGDCWSKAKWKGFWLKRSWSNRGPPPLPMPPHVLSDLVVPPGCGWSVTDPEFGTTSRRGYVVPMRTMMKWEVNLRCQGGGTLTLNSTNYPDHGHHGRLPLSRGRAGNRTRDLMVSSQELWPLSHEAGQV